MKGLRMCAVLLATFLLSGCYVATVETGRPKSTKVISKPFASSWIYGLVPPPVVQTATDCPDGVAVVQTQHSFLNYLVGAITFGIYTPIQITVTCAEGTKTGYVDPTKDIIVPPGATNDDVQRAFSIAADRAVKTGEPAYVHLQH